MVKYRKYNSPVYSASKAISFAAACVSMLTLESTMLTTFGDGTMDEIGRKILLGTSGGAISVVIIAMAVYMITQSTKKLIPKPAAPRKNMTPCVPPAKPKRRRPNPKGKRLPRKRQIYGHL